MILSRAFLPRALFMKSSLIAVTGTWFRLHPRLNLLAGYTLSGTRMFLSYSRKHFFMLQRRSTLIPARIFFVFGIIRVMRSFKR